MSDYSKVTDFHVRYNRLPTERDFIYLRELELSKVTGKFQVLDRPLLNPGKCVGCSSTRVGDRKYVDLQFDIDGYGATYICTLCVLELARVVRPQPLPDEKTPPKEFYEVLEKHRDLANSLIEHINATKPSPHVSISGEAKQAKPRPDDNESGVTESATESRREDLRGLAELLSKHDDL